MENDIQPGNTPNRPVNNRPNPTNQPRPEVPQQPRPETVLTPNDNPQQTRSPETVQTPESVEPNVANPVKANQVVQQPVKQNRIKHLLANKKFKIIATVVLAIVLLLAVYMLFLTPSNNQSNVSDENMTSLEPLTASVGLVEGLLEYSDDQGQSWQEYNQEVALSEGLWLRTGDADTDRAVIVYSNNSELRLDRQTTVIIDNIANEQTSSTISSGQVFARVVSFEDRQFAVNGQDLVGEAKGTAFRMIANTEQEVIEVYESDVFETSQNTEVKQGKKFSYQKASKTASSDDLDIEVVKQDPFIIWNRERDLDNEIFSRKLGFLSDIEAPELTVTGPADGTEFMIENGSTTVALVFIGVTEPGVTVKVEADVDEILAKEVTADFEGKFEIALSAETPGDVNFSVKAIDRSGNTSIVNLGASIIQEPEFPIELAAISQVGVGLIVNWTVADNVETNDGVRILWNRTGEPSYPIVAGQGDCNQPTGDVLINNGTTTNICLQDSQEYFLRACIYTEDGDTCDNYSNEVQITAPGGGSD